MIQIDYGKGSEIPAVCSIFTPPSKPVAHRLNAIQNAHCFLLYLLYPPIFFDRPILVLPPGRRGKLSLIPPELTRCKLPSPNADSNKEKTDVSLN